jgi:hypothetical protein
VRAYVGDAHDRVADQLAGAVIGDAAAAVGRDDFDALGAVERLAQRQLAVAGAPTARVDGGVFQQQQRVGNLVGLAFRLQPSLEGKCLAVGDCSEAPDLDARRCYGGRLLLLGCDCD